MDTQKAILIRTYLVLFALIVFAIFILGKIAYIQLVQGESWENLSKKDHIRFEDIDAERGTIYSEKGEVLSTSIPEFDIYIDWKAEGLKENNYALFHQHIDSLSEGLSSLFNDNSKVHYKQQLLKGFNKNSRFYLFKKKVSFDQYEQLRKLPLANLGKYKSGILGIVRMKRLYPFKNLANRTIGIAREKNNVGLEKYYNTSLTGENGSRLIRSISGGVGVPVDGSEREPKNGKDLVSTIDMEIQEIAHNALHKIMVKNEALKGTCIVMEVATGKVKAIANLSRQSNGNYWEDYNNALALSEPGSTWKLVTLISVLEDGYASLESQVDLQFGRWPINGLVVFDSEPNALRDVSVKTAFARSSNVGMAKLAYFNYNSNPQKYLAHINKLRMATPTGIDLTGENKPRIYAPGSKYWSKTTLPWMGFGYNLAISPLHTAMLYNAVANNGKMMKPILATELQQDGITLQQIQPEVLVPQICKPKVLADVKACLEEVVISGTAKMLKTNDYTFAGKTGTSLVADKGITYRDHMYQSSFAGYFPAQNPKYTIVVVIRNKPHAAQYYGGLVAGPVFREIADKLHSGKLYRNIESIQKPDSGFYAFAASNTSVQKITQTLNWKYLDSTNNAKLVHFKHAPIKIATMHNQDSAKGKMPNLKGLGLKDAVAWCENNGLSVQAIGRGHIIEQSISAGTIIPKGEKIIIQLN